MKPLLCFFCLLMGVLLALTAPASAQGLQGEYYIWTGSTPPSAPFLDWHRRATRIDGTVNFNWGTGAPGLGGLPANEFSVRWRGQVYLPESGSWQFFAHADDGIRLYLNHNLIIEQWTDDVLPEQSSGWMSLPAGWHDIALHYYENAGNAYVYLRFQGPGMAKQIIPASNLRPLYGKGLFADYYNGNWGGAQTHALSRNDGVINLNWGAGSPEPSINVDNFSARWRGKIAVPSTGTYTFYVNSNDGSALWVNGEPLFDALSAQDMTAQEHSASIDLEGDRNYFVELRYNEFTGNASCQLSWSGPGIAKQIIPETHLLAILNEPPGDISLSENLVYAPYGPDELVGIFTTFDVDNVTGANPSQAHTYTLVPGAGDDYNSYFKIVGTQLLTRTPGLAVGDNYSIRVRTTDNGQSPDALSYERSLIIEVVDSVPPTAVCQDIEAYLNASGVATITPDMVDGGSYDDYGIVNWTVTPSQFTCAHLGENTVTLTVFDERGNSDACLATVTVLDNLPPTVLARNVSVYLDENGEASVTPEDVNNGSHDNCGIAVLSLAKEQFGCADLGENIVTFTVEDVAGNTAQTDVAISVYDVRPPIVLTQDVTLYLDENSQAILTPDDVDAGSHDNCAIASRTLSQSLFSCAHLGVNRVTLRVTDTAGNISVEDAYVTVIQEESPILICQDMTVYLNNFGFIMLDPMDVGVGSSDKCGFQSLTLSQNVFTCDDIGENLVTLTGVGWSGLASECQAVVRVYDVMNPTLMFPSGNAITVECGFPLTLPVPVISDNCHIETAAILSFNGLDPASPALGVYEVVYGAEDSSGNVGTGILTVTVEDTIPPQMMTAPLVAECGIPFTLPDGYVLDACGMTTMEVVESQGFDPEHPEVGVYTITLRVTDQAGYSVEGERIVRVFDTLPPEVIIESQNPRFIAADIPFQVPAAHAVDACDGELTAQVIDLGGLDPSSPVMGAYTLVYESEADSGGRTGTAELELFVVPGTQPVLFINGPATPTYDCGDIYHEYGASAYDNEDGDLSSSVVVSGDVKHGDMLLPGVYQARYDVVDSTGWPAEQLVRVVTVRDNCQMRVFAKNNRTNLYANIGDSVSFEIVVQGAIGPITCQWKKETNTKAFTPILDAPDDVKFTIAHVLEEDAGRYICEVNDTVSGALSPVFTLYVGVHLPAAGIAGLATMITLLAALGVRASRRDNRRRCDG